MNDETISIGELEATRAAMTPGKYRRGEWYFEKDPDGRLAIDRPKVIQPSASNGHIVSDLPDTAVITGCGCCGSPDASNEDADGLCAEHNAMPALVAVVKAAMVHLQTLDAQTSGHRAVEASRSALRAALSKFRP